MNSKLFVFRRTLAFSIAYLLGYRRYSIKCNVQQKVWAKSQAQADGVMVGEWTFDNLPLWLYKFILWLY